jgi:3-oxoacyl-[acyl-carrier-protein] synthase-3
MFISYYLPDDVRQNADLMNRFDFDEAFLDEKIGVRTRHIASSTQGTSDLCVEAARILEREAEGYDPQAVDTVLLCTQSGDFKLPHTSAILQSALKLPRQAACFDLNLGCSGFVYGLSVIKGLLSTGTSRNVLFFTCDPYSKVLDPEDRNTVLLFGDAAAVTWIRAEDLDGGFRIGAFDLGTNGEHFESLIVRSGGVRNPLSPESNDETWSGNTYAMDGRDVYQYMVRCVPASVKKCLEKNGKLFEEIDFFLFHQASGHMLNTIQKLLRIPDEKMVRAFSDVGNTVSSTIPIGLKKLEAEHDLEGKSVLLCGFGVGLSWGTVVVEL